MSVVLGVDIGTTSAKCLAVDEEGRTLAFAQRPYGMDHPREDWAEQDPEEFFQALVDVVGRCVAECAAGGRPPSDIRAMALSAQADTLILTDPSGIALRPAISWMAQAPAARNELREAFGERFWIEQTGQPLTPYSSACKLRHLQRAEPDLMASRPHIAYVPDYLAYRLTGHRVNDVPSASWSPFFCPATRSPAVAVMAALGLDEEQLAPAFESGAVVGELLPDVGDRMGLCRGTLLIAGAFDQTAAAHGAGASAGQTSVLSCGTAWVLYAVTDRPPTPEQTGPFVLCSCCHVSPETWGLVLPFTGGSAYDWVGRTVAAGSRASDSTPLIFVPHLYGGLSPDWQEHSRGSILGLALSHTAEDIRLAVMRGLAFETRRNIEAAAPLAGAPSRLRMVGGATRSDIWPQIIADATGCVVEVPAEGESACYGAARIAAGADSEAWSSEMMRGRVYEPHEENEAAMDRLYGEYLAAYAWLTRHYRGEPAP